MKKLIGLFIILNACGQAPENLSTEPTLTAQPSASAESASATTDDPNLQSLYLDKKSDLWPCTEALYRQLVYITEETTFYACQKNDWVKVEIKGEKGEDGVDGEDGEDGKNGKDGKDGKDGLSGSNGKDGLSGKDGVAGKDGQDGQDGDDGDGVVNEDAPLMANEWIDPITKYRWFTGRRFTALAIIQMGNFCPTGSSMPTEEEVSQAGLAGLYDNYTAEAQLYIKTTDIDYAKRVAPNAITVAGGVNEFSMLRSTHTLANNSSYAYRTLCVIK